MLVTLNKNQRFLLSDFSCDLAKGLLLGLLLGQMMFSSISIFDRIWYGAFIFLFAVFLLVEAVKLKGG